MTIVTTAAPYRPDKGDQGPGAPYNGGAKFYQVYSGDTSQTHDLRISHIGYDRVHTTADRQRHLVPAAGAAARGGGRAASARSRRGSMARPPIAATASRWRPMRPEILRRCQEDGADAAILVPNCPVCHQTCSLVARHLEANGIPTVVMGCAKDIVEHAAVPRFLFSDFPLGNSAGRPHDVASQDRTLELALRVLEAAPGPRTTMQSPLRWSEDAAWKLDYLNLERIRARGAGAAAARVRRAEGGRADAARGEGSVRRPSAWPPRRRGAMTAFANVRVLDFTQVLAGPYGSYQLALLGADVIKVERREGEDMRRTPLSREWAERGMAPAWLAINGNKRSLTLDLQKPAAIEIVNRLVARRRRGDGEFPARRDGPPGHRLRGAARDQSEADLLHDLRLRQHRAVPQRGRLRRQDPGAVRHHVADRPQGDGADARRLRGVRRAVGHDRGLRRVLGAVSAHAYRRRASSSTCRCWRRASRSCPPRSPTSPSPATGRSSSATRRSAARSPPTCSAPRTAGCCSR